MLTSMIQALMLGMLVLPVFPQDEPPPTSGDTSEESDYITDLKKRAKQGDALFQFLLANTYDFGDHDVPQDYKEAVRWYRAAADQGLEEAQFNLGVMYDEGKGVPQDYQEAFRWYRSAAEQGYASAQNNLGVMYKVGKGVPQDFIQAHMWYNLAASSLTGDDREAAAKNRDLTAEKMTSEQIAEAQRQAREWKPKSGGQ